MAAPQTYIDLHTHSTASDGSVTPCELSRLAAAVGLTTYALTDHDTTAGLQEAGEEAAALGIEFIPGCELSATGPYGPVDILGLWVPLEHPEFEAAMQKLRNGRSIRNKVMFEKLRDLGVCLDESVLAGAAGSAIGRPHLAKQMVRQGYVKTVGEAFDRYLGKDKPAFVQKQEFSTREAVSLLKSVGASSFIAHPLLIHAPFQWLEDEIRSLVPFGLDGIEAYHSEHSPAGTERLLNLARRCNVLVSGGSDFHGDVKPAIRLGCGKGALRVPPQVLDDLKAHRRSLGLHS